MKICDNVDRKIYYFLDIVHYVESFEMTFCEQVRLQLSGLLPVVRPEGGLDWLQCGRDLLFTA